MDTLSPIEIDIGRKVARCSHMVWAHLIFLFCSTIMPIPSRFGRLSLPSLYSFCIYGRIWLLSPLDIFVLALLKRFESLANDRDSLVAFIFISTGLSAAIR